MATMRTPSIGCEVCWEAGVSPRRDYLADDPEFAKLFDHAMTSLSEMAEATVIAGYDFSPYSTIVDVGGGHGRLLAGNKDSSAYNHHVTNTRQLLAGGPDAAATE